MSKGTKKQKNRVLELLAKYENRILDISNEIQKGKFYFWDIEDEIKGFTKEFHSLPENIQTELRRVIREYNELGEKKDRQNEKSIEEMKKSLANLRELVIREINIRF